MRKKSKWEISSYIIVGLGLLFFCHYLYQGLFVNEERDKYWIDVKLRLGLSESAQQSDISEAIPKQFKMGSTQDEVLQRVLEIDPNFDIESHNHDFNICRTHYCFDAIEFYDSPTLDFLFSYDRDGKLFEIEHSPP